FGPLGTDIEVGEFLETAAGQHERRTGGAGVNDLGRDGQTHGGNRFKAQTLGLREKKTADICGSNIPARATEPRPQGYRGRVGQAAAGPGWGLGAALGSGGLTWRRR